MKLELLVFEQAKKLRELGFSQIEWKYLKIKRGNVFKNAHSGKPYMTRDGRKASFIRFYTIKPYNVDLAWLLIEPKGEIGQEVFSVHLNGFFYGEGEQPCSLDIVSEWIDPADNFKWIVK